MRDFGETGPMNGNDRGCPGWASQVGSKSEPRAVGMLSSEVDSKASSIKMGKLRPREAHGLIGSQLSQA